MVIAYLFPVLMTLAAQEGGQAPQPPAQSAPVVQPGTGQPAEGPPPAGQPAPEASDGGGWGMLIPFALIFVVFYFLLIRPQQKQTKERESMVSNLRRGDRVVTSGGIKGRIQKIKDNDVYILVDEKNGTVLHFIKSAVVMLEQKGEDSESSEGKKEEKGSETEPPPQKN